jgi:hypothetical protein
MKKKILNVGMKEFLEWYIDENTIDIILEILRKKGNVEVKDLVCELGYIPVYLIANDRDIDKDDIDNEEIENPTGKYIINIVNK